MSDYTTTQGDTFDFIALKEMGSEKMAHHLIEANPDHKDVFIFGAGVVLDVPEMKNPITTDPVPPWQK